MNKAGFEGKKKKPNSQSLQNELTKIIGTVDCFLEQREGESWYKLLYPLLNSYTENVLVTNEISKKRDTTLKKENIVDF